MRIISKYKDYYDGVMAMGIDFECPYIREKQEIILDKTESHVYINSWKRGMEINGSIYDITNYKYRDYTGNKFEEMTDFIIGFCGEIYPCIRTENEKHEITYTYQKTKKESSSADKKRYHMGNEVDFFDKNWDSYKKYFIEYKTPIFVIRPQEFNNEYMRTKVITINDELKQYNFMKIKDPYTAYQEIYQYISGILGVNQRPIIELSDEQIKAKHGFSHKYAFKKEPKN